MQFWYKFSIATWLAGPCVVAPCASHSTFSPALLSSQPGSAVPRNALDAGAKLARESLWIEAPLTRTQLQREWGPERLPSAWVAPCSWRGWARCGSVAVFVPWQTNHRLEMRDWRTETPTSKGQKRCRALLNAQPFPLRCPNTIFGKLVPCTRPWRYLPKLAIVW